MLLKLLLPSQSKRHYIFMQESKDPSVTVTPAQLPPPKHTHTHTPSSGYK